MILFVGFPDVELGLLDSAAKKLGVQDSCKYIAEIGGEDIEGNIIDTDAIYDKLPSVIFLNLDAQAQHWETSLKQLKDHDRLKGLPIVGLGRIPRENIPALYDMRINSYIEKPHTFEEMVKAADISLKFWLEISRVPGRYLDE